jgi:hypothetical protein
MTIDEAARARKAHAEERKQDTVDALLHERRGYVQRGLQGRVDQVDEQLRRNGAKPPAEKVKVVPKVDGGKS